MYVLAVLARAMHGQNAQTLLLPNPVESSSLLRWWIVRSVVACWLAVSQSQSVVCQIFALLLGGFCNRAGGTVPAAHVVYVSLSAQSFKVPLSCSLPALWIGQICSASAERGSLRSLLFVHCSSFPAACYNFQCTDHAVRLNCLK